MIKSYLMKKHEVPYKPGIILISQYRIQSRVKELAQRIAKDYHGKDLVIVGIMKGTYILLADLTRELYSAGLKTFLVSFITAKSYGSGTVSKKDPNIVDQIDIELKNRHILLVDDIIDTGKTLKITVDSIKKGAVSIRSFVLLSKDERREVSFEPDYYGFKIPNVWVQGYGMDTDEKGRGNRDIIIGGYG